jgi:hypothetical protein
METYVTLALGLILTERQSSSCYTYTPALRQSLYRVLKYYGRGRLYNYMPTSANRYRGWTKFSVVPDFRAIQVLLWHIYPRPPYTTTSIPTLRQ